MKRTFTSLLAVAVLLTGATALWADNVSSPFITDQNLGTPRSDFFGFVGIKLTIGDQPVTVTELGRLCLAGNSQDHVVKLARASDGKDMASVTVAMAGGAAGDYVYAPLLTPIVLSAHTAYYLGSEEAGSQDDWTDLDTSVQTSDIGVVDGATFIGSGFPWTVAREGGFAFGPVNFKYSTGPTVDIISPADGTSIPSGGDVTISTTVGDYSGNITHVEFFDGNISLGVDDTAPYSFTVNNPSSGVHTFTAVATDDQNQSALSGSVALEVIACDQAVSFVTGFTPGSLRNNFNGPVGMKITIGDQPVLVTDLGRLFLADNRQTHQVRLVRASDETDLADGSVMIDMAGGVAGEFKYASLGAPIVLQANTAYYLVSLEYAGGDSWHEHNSIVSVSPVARVDGASFRTYEWATISGANHTFVPISFKYAPCGVTNAPAPVVTNPPPANVLPVVALTAPADQTTLEAPASFALEASAQDSDGHIVKIEFFSGETKLGEDDSAPYQLIWNNVPAGQYALSARATDNEGALVASMPITVIVVEAQPEPTPELPPGMGQITLLINGEGRISPNLDGRLLPLGRRYSISAAPARGMVFSNWTGDVISESPRLVFEVQPHVNLQANFIPNPFDPTQGIYNGLFYPAQGIGLTDSGFIYVVVSSRGTFSGWVILEGKRNNFRGAFDLSGHSTATVVRRGAEPLSIDLQLDLTGGDQITGAIYDGNWTAPLAADRATFHARNNPANEFAGNYTIVLNNEGQDELAATMGYGYGYVRITTSGIVRLYGILPDGTRFVQTARLSKTGQWPLHAPLYRGAGLMSSWLALNSPQPNEISGLALWVHPEQPRARLYREGFTNNVMINGARFTAPISKTNGIIDVVQGIFAVSEGDLPEPIINDFMLTPPNRINNLSSNRLVLSLSTKNGLFRGYVEVPGQRQRISVEGALLQNQNAGWGFGRGTNHSAKVFLGSDLQ